MKIKELACNLLFYIGCVTTPAFGADLKGLELGVRGGTALDGKDSDFDQYEIFATYPLPYQWQLGSGWTVRAQTHATLGEIDGNGVNGLVASVGGGVSINRSDKGFFVDLGSGPTYVEEDVYSDKDLGGNIHFTSFINLGYRFNQHLSIAYRIHHISNAGIEEPNPGLDIQSLQIGYRF